MLHFCVVLNDLKVVVFRNSADREREGERDIGGEGERGEGERGRGEEGKRDRAIRDLFK